MEASTIAFHTTCFILAASLTQGALNAQSTLPLGPGHVRAWSRTFGTSALNEGPYDLRRAANGDVLVAGSTVVGGASMAGWLLRVDALDGTLLAQHALTHPFATTSDGAGLSADGGALFLGRDVLDLFVKHDAWAVRADAAGQVLWSLGFTRPGVGRHFLLDAAELADGSWILCGSAGLTDEPPQQGWLVKLSAAGALVWQYEYGAGSADALSSVVPTADGGFVAAGATDSSGAGGNDAWVLRVDALGAIQWQRTFGGPGSEQATQIVELAGGGYAVCGFSDGFTSSGHAPWVLRLGANGDLAWSRVVASSVWGDLYGLAESAPGRIVVLGRTNAGDPSNELWAAELAALDGALHWQRAYAGASGDWGSAVLALQGAGLVLGGVWGWGFAEEDIWLTRTDAQGRLRGCALEHATDFALAEPTVVAQPGVALLRPAGAVLQGVTSVSTPTAATALERCP
jgi:hypothetical protein